MRPVYLFLHIQKTGGTTLRHHFRSALRRQRRGVHTLWGTRENKPPDSPDRIDLVVGHVVTAETASWFPGREARHFTVLRDPVAQTISAYNWNCLVRAQEQHLPPLPFDEWFVSGRQSIQARALVRFANAVVIPSQQYLYERARAALRLFWLIGRTEDFEHSLWPVFAALSAPPPIAESRKVAGADVKAVLQCSPEIEALIRERATADMALYQEFSRDTVLHSNQLVSAGGTV